MVPTVAAQANGPVAAEEGLLSTCRRRARARFARPTTTSARPRPLAEVSVVLGSGGVLRHSPPEVSAAVLAAVTGDHGGGWRVPDRARVGVDSSYVLFVVGLLSQVHPSAARALAGSLARG